MNQVQRLDRIPPLNHTRNIYLACALRYHFDVHVPLRKRREHPPSDTDHIAHLRADEAENRHILVHRHAARAAELAQEPLQVAALQMCALERHRHVHLARADEVDDDAEAVERAEDACEEAVRDALPVGQDVKHDNPLFDCHGRWQLWAAGLTRERGGGGEGRGERAGRRGVGEGAEGCKRVSGGKFFSGEMGVDVWLRMDDGTPARRVFDVFDADGDFFTDHL